MKKQTMMEGLLQNLAINNIKKLNRTQLKEIIFKLKREFNFTYNKLSKITNIPETTLKNWGSDLKQDSTQTTHRMIKSGLDLDVLIRHFQVYMPRGNEEKEQIKKLIMVLSQCLRK